ncbi:MAG TPA: DUF6306 domain-containing protein [Ktedonobacterales bacterium]|nr:DUF6306 domain-containing protein [Ktedonobacterales bacterium]
MERTVGPQIIRTLNEMLEEERAAVEAVIGLASMATDPNEREMLQHIGSDEVWACSGLRARIDGLGGAPSLHISDFANYVLSLEYYPERLRTFGRHQRLIMERIATLLAQRTIDPETKTFLDEMRTQHETDIAWCENRASVFESSRYMGEAPPSSPSRVPVMPSPSVRELPFTAPSARGSTPPSAIPSEPFAAPARESSAPPPSRESPVPPPAQIPPASQVPPAQLPPAPPPVDANGATAEPPPAPEKPKRGRRKATPAETDVQNNGADPGK